MYFNPNISQKDSNGRVSDRDCLEFRLRVCDPGPAWNSFERPNRKFMHKNRKCVKFNLMASKGYKLNAGKTGCIDIHECARQLGFQIVKDQFRSFQPLFRLFSELRENFESRFMMIIQFARTTIFNIVKIQLEVISVYRIIYR